MKPALFVAVLFIACSQATHAITLYSVTDLGDFPGGAEQSQAQAINDAGQVVGVGQNSSRNRAFLTSFNPSGSVDLIDLGALPNLPSTSAHAINARGQIVGGSSDGDKGRPFLWTPSIPNSASGTMVEVDNLIGERNNTNAVGINARGQIVGTSSGRGYLWTPTTPNGSTGSAVGLGTVPNGNPGSLAFGINDSGQVVGIVGTTAGDHAFLWTPTSPNGAAGAMIDLGNLPGGNGTSQAFAINNAGSVVGNSATETAQHAFLWTPGQNGGGTMIDLGDLEGGNDLSFAYGINSANRVVGYSNSAESDHAFVWTSNDGMNDLNSLTDATGTKWTLSFAQGINNLGQIAGWGTFDPDGPGGVAQGTHAFRLEPVAELITGQLHPRRDATGALALHFAGTRGVTYQLETAATLTGPWQADSATFLADGRIANFQPRPSGERTFWRIAQVE